jgi:CRP-like cAMP-binding protein
VGIRGPLPATGACYQCHARPGHLFSCLSRDHVAAVERARAPRAYATGQVLFHEGDPPLVVYCISSGSVRLARQSGHGNEVAIGIRGAGDLVGFRAVFAMLPYGATAVTLGPSGICAIPRAAFLDSVARSSALALELLRRLAARSRLTEEQLVNRAAEHVRARTARLLLGLQRLEDPHAGGQTAPTAGVGREEMALLIGTTRETLSRTLHEFVRQGLLELLPSGIRLLDPKRLKAILDS